MTIPVNSGDIYTDVSSLRGLKRDAASGSQAALEKTAEQFEALFLQMMLKSMRQAAPSDGMFDSDQTRFYQDMFDQQIAIDMAKKRQLGIADLLVKQLGKQQTEGAAPAGDLKFDIERLRVAQAAATPAAMPLQPQPAVAAGAGPAPAAEAADAAGRERVTPAVAAPTATENSVAPASRATAPVAEIKGFDSPADFIEKLMPLAEKYGAELGVDPRALLAQAALETGWGRSVSRDARGVSSHNLFNIKADQRWSGPQTVVSTLEYEQGRPVRQQAAFRAYADFEASFRDYAAFLKSSPRYQQALAQADDGHAFVRALHQAGYATDPKYAEKVGAILARL